MNDYADKIKFSIFWNTGRHEVKTFSDITEIFEGDFEESFFNGLKYCKKGQCVVWSDGISKDIYFTCIEDK